MTEATAGAPSRASSSLLVVADPGGGKTTQLLTLPRPLGIIAWEPKTREAIPPGLIGSGEVVIYDFILEDYELSSRLDPDGNGAAKVTRKKAAFDMIEKYKAWHEGMSRAENKEAGSGWGKCATWGLDTYSTLAQVHMASVIEARGHAMPVTSGRNEQNDTVPVQAATRGVLASLIALSYRHKFVFACNAHQRPLRETKGDNQGQVLEWEPQAPGALRTDLPGMFSNAWFLLDDSSAQVRKFVLQTRSGGSPKRKCITSNTVAQAGKGMPPFRLDVTLDWTKPLATQGIGGLLQGKWAEVK